MENFWPAFWLVAIVLDIGAGILVANVAHARGRAAWAWFAISLVFSPIVALLALGAMPLVPASSQTPPPTGSKTSPTSTRSPDGLLSQEETLAEARRRWGNTAVVWVNEWLFEAYHVGVIEPGSGRRKRLGRGGSWSEALADADKKAKDEGGKDA